MQYARVGRDPYQNREAGGDDVPAARVVEDSDTKDVAVVPDQRETGHEVRQEVAGQDEVGLGPESGRHTDGYQRKAVSAEAEYRQNEKDGNH